MTAVELDGKQKRALVDRVANSASFQKSPRLRAFLLYAANCTLNERPEEAREQQIAQNVFHRRPDYNPGQDNIVRVEARSLRKRLETYFSNEGKDEPFLVVMPRGSYAIAFEPRSTQAAASAEPAIAPAPAAVSPALQAAAAPAPAESEPEGKSADTYARRFRAAVAVICLLLVAIAAQFYFSRIPGESVSPAARILPFSALLDDSLDTLVVTSDTCLVLMQELTHRHVTLEDYIPGRYPGEDTISGPKLEVFRFLLDRQYTDAHEAAIAGQILQVGRHRQRMYLRSARKVQLSDFQSHNVVLLGGSISNPWAGMYTDQLNFQYCVREVPEGQSVLFRNRSPRPGEQAEYFTPIRSGQSGETYAAIGFLPNVSGGGNALLITGTTAEATAAAGNFILDAARTSKALQAIGIDPSGPPRYFELLLKAMTFPGGATEASLVAWRLVPEPK